MRKIPRLMSTQHPDNARIPEWVSSEIIEGELEVIEAYKAFSEYNIEEVMWDAEGKDVDTHVVRKLLSYYPEFFKENVIGQDIFITYRIPNPKVEKTERKILSETLESIVVSYDVAETFYGRNVIPIFEVILPFTTSYEELLSIIKYYEKVIAGKENVELFDGIKVKDIIGDTNPKSIEIIPLVEDMNSLLNIRKIVEGFWRHVKPSYLRVFIARSDPAMNYGLLSAILLAKYALSELYKLSKEISLSIFPIIGVGSLPFRGNFNPENIENVLNEYKGVATFTVQAAFKYDYPKEEVLKAIEKVRKSDIEEPYEFTHEEKKILEKIILKYSKRYQKEIESLESIINKVAEFIPKRRARKLHIGLFGYSRGIGKITLPRAIPFCGSLYSIGIPPEILGLSSLNELDENEWNLLSKSYLNFKKDLEQCSRFINYEALDILERDFGINKETIQMIKEDINYLEKQLGIKIGGNNYYERKHSFFSTLFLSALKENNIEEAKFYIKEMALIRKSIG